MCINVCISIYVYVYVYVYTRISVICIYTCTYMILRVCVYTLNTPNKSELGFALLRALRAKGPGWRPTIDEPGA